MIASLLSFLLVLRQCLARTCGWPGLLVRALAVLVFGAGCAWAQTTVTIATGQSVSGTINLDSYGVSPITTVTCSGGTGTPYAGMTAKLGNYSISAGGVTGGGGSVVFRNLVRNADGSWLVGQVVATSSSSAAQNYSNITLPNGQLGYSGGGATGTSITVSLSYTLSNGSPTELTTSCPLAAYYAGESATFTFTATDTDNNLKDIEVLMRKPDGSQESVAPGWVTRSATGTGLLTYACTLAPFDSKLLGTYEVWARVRDANGAIWDPVSLGKPAQRKRITVVSAPPVGAAPGTVVQTAQETRTVDSGPTLNRSVNLNLDLITRYTSIDCGISGGGGFASAGNGMPSGTIYFNASIAGQSNSLSVNCVGGGGGATAVRLVDVAKQADGTWLAAKVEKTDASGVYVQSATNVNLGSGVLTYTTSMGANGLFSGSSSSSVKLVYPANHAPNSSAVSGLKAQYTVGQRATVTFSATDPDSNLTDYRVYWKTPSGVIEAKTDWLSVSSTGAASASKVYELPAFAQEGTYEVWAEWRDLFGALRKPLSTEPACDYFSERAQVKVLPAGAGSNGGGVANALGDPDSDGWTNVAEHNLGTNPGVANPGASTSGATAPEGWSMLVAPDVTKTAAVGASMGQMSVGKGGELTYSFAIPAVPGTAGMQPQFSLGYSSQAGPGIAGLGWSLSGLTNISRGPQTKAVDGVFVGVSLTATDRFYLDGQRLIAINNGIYGANGTEYRTEMDSFSRIVSYGASGSGPTYFKVWTKAGLCIEIGTTEDSRVNATGRNEILSWSVSRITDTAGNYMEYTYAKDALRGTQLLSRVKYTGNVSQGVDCYASLRFTYADRPDISVGYMKGTKLASLQRLASVSSYFGETRVHTVSLGYTSRGVAQRSLLTSITETGSDGTSTLPLSFEYTPTETGWTYSPLAPPIDLVTGDKGQGTGFVDLNGDGLPDLVQSLCDTNGNITASHAYLNTGSDWVDTPAYCLPYGLTQTDGKTRGGYFADIDGDGLVDFMYSRGDICRAYKNTGSGWLERVDWRLPSGIYVCSGDANRPRFFLDVNADGLPDLVYRNTIPGDGSTEAAAVINRSNVSGLACIWESDANFIPPVNFASKFDHHTIFTDINGDGLPDLLTNQDDGRSWRGVALNTGTGWRELFGTELELYITPCVLSRYHRGDNTELNAYACELTDINGDGLPDFVEGDEWFLAGLDHGEVHLNTGAGWALDSSRNFKPFMGAKGASRGTAVIDVNADGLPDIVQREGSGISSDTISVALGTGSGFVQLAATDLSTHALPYPLDGTPGSGVSAAGADMVDLNGDGAVDQVMAKDGKRYASLNRASPAVLLNKVTSGYGVKAQVTYKQLTDKSVYVKGTGSVYPKREVIGPMYVVAQLRNDDGVGGTHDQHYLYGGMRSDAVRGNLGFDWMSVQDSLTQIRSTTVFSQDFPTIGMPIESFTTTASGLTLSSSSVKYAVKEFNGGKTKMPFAYESVETSYDLTGTLVKKTVTEVPQNGSGFDDYGNALYLKVSVGDASVTDETGGFVVKETTSTYENWVNDSSNANPWMLGRLMTSQVTTSSPGKPSRTRKTAFDYDSTTGFLNMEIVEPELPDTETAGIKLTTTYTHDAFGNKTSVTVKGYGLDEGRTSSTTYNPADVPGSTGIKGRFALRTTNAKGHSETYEYDQASGSVTRQVGPNLLPTSWTYDGFGRKVLETRADGTTTEIKYRWAGAGAPAGALYLQESLTSGVPPSVTFFDAFGRGFVSFGVNGGGLDGKPRIVGVWKFYDRFGRNWKSSLPFYLGETPKDGAFTESFDLMGRPLVQRVPHETGVDSTVSFIYSGLSNHAVDAKGIKTTTVSNLLGQVVRVVTNADAAQDAVDRGEVVSVYDVEGNKERTRVRKAGGTYVDTVLVFDARGRKTSMVDPNMGTWSYTYNAAGELVSQKDAKAQPTTMTYDSLGRMLTRVEPDVTTTWVYDTAERAGGAVWLGKLKQVSTSEDRGKTFTETYSFDEYGRAETVTSTINGKAFATHQKYDSFGRPTITKYPSGFKTRNVYSSYGFLKEVREAGAADLEDDPSGRLKLLNEVVPGQVFWRADSYAANGSVDGSTLGNGVTFDRVISPFTGRVQAITAGVGSALGMQYIVYDFDQMGNVTRRNDQSTGRDERFTYDAMSRLQSFMVNGTTAQTMTYNALGNIATKSDLGAYAYESARPNAVTKVTRTAGAPLIFNYDANGNMVSSGPEGTMSDQWRVIEYSAANQVRKMSLNNVTSEFWFGAAHERVLQVHSSGKRTYYVGSLYEEIRNTADEIAEKKHYIMTPLGRTAVRVEYPGNKVETRYFHQDALGSIFAVSNEWGVAVQRFTYDPWGKRPSLQLAGEPASEGKVTRGFTDHEHLEDFGLIHMNGRVFDPVLGRFLSADPFVEDAHDSQAFNRYSYVSNNPLNHTDPSGYFKLGGIITTIIAVVVAAVVTVITAGGAAALIGAFWSTLTTAGFGAVVAGGAAGGFASGFAGSLLNGGSLGDAFKAGIVGAAVGAVSAAASYGVGQLFDKATGFFKQGTTANWAGRAMAHGVAQGAIAEASGGEFRHGFYAGAFSSAASPLTRQIKMRNAGAQYTARLVATAVIGGTGAVLGGGRFANGAVTGAFVYMFNQAMEKAESRHPKKVAWVTVEAAHADIPAQDDSGITKEVAKNGLYMNNDMEVEDSNSKWRPFVKRTRYLDDGDQLDVFVVTSGTDMVKFRSQLVGYDRVYLFIHGTIDPGVQLYYFCGQKINRTELNRRVPNITRDFGCRVGAPTTCGAQVELVEKLIYDYLRN